jgi:periplasmic copper chaperone A
MRYLLTLIGAALVLAPAAGAHVTVNPDEVPAGSFSRFAIRVPNERGNTDTTKVTVRLPKGLFFVSFQPKAGWKRTVKMQKLNPPATVFGEKVTERVATVTWEGGRIRPGEFDEFGLSAKVPDASGTTLVFPALQTYSNGEIVRWIGPEEADEPASRVTLEPKEDQAAAPAPAPVATPASESDDDRANLALAFGIGGLVVGLGALGLSLWRRPRSA